MTQQTNGKEHNIEGLRRSAQQKAEMTRQRAEEAITLLLKTQRPINFKAVAETAKISTAWLYANEAIKMRIIHLREAAVPKAVVAVPAREQASNASKDAMITALKRRVHEQAERIKELEKQLEAAYGALYQR